MVVLIEWNRKRNKNEVLNGMVFLVVCSAPRFRVPRFSCFILMLLLPFLSRSLLFCALACRSAAILHGSSCFAEHLVRCAFLISSKAKQGPAPHAAGEPLVCIICLPCCCIRICALPFPDRGGTGHMHTFRVFILVIRVRCIHSNALRVD